MRSRAGIKLPVQLIDALIELTPTGTEVICGLKGQCHLQMIVEAAGSVCPCYFYVLAHYRMGDLIKTPLFSPGDAPAALKIFKRKTGFA